MWKWIVSGTAMCISHMAKNIKAGTFKLEMDNPAPLHDWPDGNSTRKIPCKHPSSVPLCLARRRRPCDRPRCWSAFDCSTGSERRRLGCYKEFVRIFIVKGEEGETAKKKKEG